jgi:hypothetical protein
MKKSKPLIWADKFLRGRGARQYEISPAENSITPVVRRLVRSSKFPVAKRIYHRGTRDECGARARKDFCPAANDQSHFIRRNAKLSIESFLFLVAALTLCLVQWQHRMLS